MHMNRHSGLASTEYAKFSLELDLLDEDDHNYPDLVVPFVPTVTTEH